MLIPSTIVMIIKYKNKLYFFIKYILNKYNIIVYKQLITILNKYKCFKY